MTIDDLRDAWLDHLNATGRTTNTLKVYLSDLTFLIDYLRERRVTRVDGVTPQHLAIYRRRLESDGSKSPRTISRHVGTIRGWFRWLVETGRLKTSPAERLKRPQVDMEPSRGAYRVTREMAETVAGDDLAARRDRAILAVMADTQLSAAKMALLSIEDVIRKEHAIQAPGVRMPLSEAAWSDLEQYLRLRNRAVSDEIGHLWLSLRTGALRYKRLSERHIQQLANHARQPVR